MADSAQNDIPVILNPKARSEGARSTTAQVAALSHRVKISETTAPLDARRIAAELARAGHPLIVAAGGDGTVNEVVAGIADAQEARPGAMRPALGILPLGTMNVLARELGIPRGDLRTAWNTICSGLHTDIDLWLANDIPFVQMAGVGLDAEIIRRTTWQSKKRLGPLSYLLSWLRMTGEARPKLRVEIPGRAEPIDAGAVLLGNGRLYGGSFPFFPDACNRDGLLDIVVFRKLGGLVLPQLVLALASGHRCPSRHVTYARAESLTVVSATGSDGPFEVDGEYAGKAPVVFRRATLPLRVAVPQQAFP